MLCYFMTYLSDIPFASISYGRVFPLLCITFLFRRAGPVVYKLMASPFAFLNVRFIYPHTEVCPLSLFMLAYLSYLIIRLLIRLFRSDINTQCSLYLSAH